MTLSAFPSSQIGTPLFGIVAHEGSYDDAYQHTLFVTPDERAARAYVDYHNAVRESMRAKIAQSHKESDAWAAANPQPIVPDFPPEGLLDVPSWTGIRNITPEMRAERKNLKAENERRMSKLRAPMHQWFQDRMAVATTWQAANLTEAEKLAYQHDNDTRYDVEDLSWMPPLESLLPPEELAKLNSVNVAVEA